MSEFTDSENFLDPYGEGFIDESGEFIDENEGE